MLTLAASDTLAASTTTATTVNYTIFGDQVTSSGDAYQCLAQGQLAVTAGTIYTSPSLTQSMIASIMLYNTSATVSQTVNIFRGGTASANQLCQIGIPAGGFAVYESGTGWTVYGLGGVPISPAVMGQVSSYITGTVAVAASTLVNITSVSLGPGTWLIFSTGFFHLTTATLGHMDAWLGPTSASKTGAYTALTGSMGNIAGGTEEWDVSLMTIQTFTATTTVFLEAFASEATTAENNSTEQTIGNCTGIIALQLAA